MLRTERAGAGEMNGPGKLEWEEGGDARCEIVGLFFHCSRRHSAAVFLPA